MLDFSFPFLSLLRCVTIHQLFHCTLTYEKRENKALPNSIANHVSYYKYLGPSSTCPLHHDGRRLTLLFTWADGLLKGSVEGRLDSSLLGWYKGCGEGWADGILKGSVKDRLYVRWLNVRLIRGLLGGWCKETGGTKESQVQVVHWQIIYQLWTFLT